MSSGDAVLLVGNRPQLHDLVDRLQLLIANLELRRPADDSRQAPHQPTSELNLFFERNSEWNQGRRDDHTGQTFGVADSGDEESVESLAIGRREALEEPRPCEIAAAEGGDPFATDPLEQFRIDDQGVARLFRKAHRVTDRLMGQRQRNVRGKTIASIDQPADQLLERVVEIEFSREFAKNLILQRGQRAVPADGPQVLLDVVNLPTEALLQLAGSAAAQEVEHVLQSADQHHGDEVTAGDGPVAELQQIVDRCRERRHEKLRGFCGMLGLKRWHGGNAAPVCEG